MMTSTVMRGRRFVLTIVALLMLAALSATFAGEVRAQAPTVGDIVVESYDCDTGLLRFRVPVTDLPFIPDSNGSLAADVSMQYAQGPLDSPFPTQPFNPQPELAPYTGDVSLGRFVPPSAVSTDASEPSGPLVSIDLRVSVGDATGQTDTSTLTYAVDCGDEGDIVDQLIAILVRILQDILGE